MFNQIIEIMELTEVISAVTAAVIAIISYFFGKNNGKKSTKWKDLEIITDVEN